MLLQRGISGYYNLKESTLPSTDFNEFKGICHLVGVQYGGQVLGFREAYRSGLPNNYHLAWLCHKYDSKQVLIIFLNAHYPFVAFAIGENGDADGTLPEHGSWQSVNQVFESLDVISILSTRYRLLEPQDLQEPLQFRLDNKAEKIVLENPHELAESEVAMIHRWHKTLTKPITIGDVVFNWWD
jgi:hypothetical protein